MIAKIRSFAKGIGTKIMLALLILTFAIWGVGDILSGAGGNVEVATVGGEGIPYQEYAIGVHQETERLRQMLGKQFTPDIAKNFGIEPRVLQGLVDRRLFVLESNALGLRVSDAEVARKIRTNPLFLDDKGNFSKAQFEAKLRAIGQSEKDFVRSIREDMAVALLIETIMPTVTPPPSAAEVLLAARDEQRKILLYNISAEQLKDLPTPSAEQLKEYYSSHSAQFSVPEYRTISFVRIAKEDAKKSSGISEKDIEIEYKQRLDEFKKPERRRLEQLLFGSEDAAKKAVAAMASGKTFEQEAREAKILNPDRISLGVMERANVLDAAADKVFALKLGGVTEPIKSQFGWHIFRVSEILPAATLGLAEVRDQIVKDLQAQSEDDALTGLTNKLEDLIAGGSTLSEAAKELALKIETLPPIDKKGLLASGEAARAVPKDEKFLETAFRTDEKTESQAVASKDGYYILRVEKIEAEHSRPFDEVKVKLAAGWMENEKARKLAELSDKISGEFVNPAGREQAIKSYGLSAPATLIISRSKESGQKLPAPMVMDIFAKNETEATKAFVQADGSYAIAVISDVIPASIGGKDAAAFAGVGKQYSKDVQNEISEQYLRYLAKKYPVTINLEALKIKSSD